MNDLIPGQEKKLKGRLVDGAIIENNVVEGKDVTMKQFGD